MAAARPSPTVSQDARVPQAALPALRAALSELLEKQSVINLKALRWICVCACAAQRIADSTIHSSELRRRLC